MDDLSFVSTRDLIEELGKRFDHWSCVGYTLVQHGSDKDEPRHRFLQEWHGNPHTVIGMLQTASALVVSSYLESQSDLDTDQDYI